ncbi:transglutaminase-like domain-containing protein [Georgenia sp. Z1344]|uniref:transglutaminase-like domain-containing protein n=1 Tax=Georgenia sp. Z1344 TaxID=3416706 RepID=UPI003CF8B05B
MQRSVTASLQMTTRRGATRLAFLVSVARQPGLTIDERLVCRLGESEVDLVEFVGRHGTVTHVLDLPDDTELGTPLTLDYEAQVGGDGDLGDMDEPAELLEFLRPSRYAESDRLFRFARSQFAGLTGLELVRAVESWVNTSLAYVRDSSRPTDGAVETMLARQGVCRDYAHLVVALLRAMDVPARVTSVYAPGLSPMDFHAVAEAWHENRWHAIDATRLAPRRPLLRISTGRDAADNAFLSSYGGGINFRTLQVTATIDGDLPADDHADPVQIA